MASQVGSKRKYAAINKSRRAAAHDSDEEEDEISDDEYDHVAVGGAGMGSSATAGTRTANIAGLKHALSELVHDAPWIDRMEVVSADPTSVDAADDLKLELALCVPRRAPVA